MIIKSWDKYLISSALMGIIYLSGMVPLAFGDVYINVMAVNGSPTRKETPVKYDLPGDLKAQDIVDTNGLQLEYNVNDANFYVHGTVTLDPKESKTFRIRVKDIWKITPDQTEAIKDEINRGFEQIGKLSDPQKGEILKQQLIQKLDNFVDQQATKADSVEKRIDSFRTYRKEMERLKNQALAVDYWRSEPGEAQEKIIHFKIEVENPESNPSKTVKQKHYLPSEIKPEHVVESQGFEVRYDASKQQSFLFKEEEMSKGQKKTYSIGIRDVWSIPGRDINYLRARANYAYDFLKKSKFAESSKILYDHANILLEDIVKSQGETMEIKEHISAFRVNQQTYDQARTDVENLEKLLAILREDLEKSKVKNVLQKVGSLKGVAGLAQELFKRKPSSTMTWKIIGWTLVFVAFITAINFVVWVLRSADKKRKLEEADKEEANKK